MCAVCARGYRDKRELKKHQVAHNHSGQSAPIPGTNPAPVPSAAPAQQVQILQQTPVVSAQSSGQVVQGVAAGDKAIVIQQTLSLPSQPVPKEQLSNGSPQQVQVQVQPLNPATIPLPPSVATALQSINDKVSAKQARARQQQQQQQQVPQQVQQQATTITLQAPKQELAAAPAGAQLVALPANAQLVQAANPGGTGGNGGPLFYYFMPGNVPYNISSEGGANVRVTTGEGNVATAQLISVPASAIQGVQSAAPQAATVATAAVPALTTASATLPAGWVLEGTSGTATLARAGGGPM